jgi:hypothetical protein
MDDSGWRIVREEGIVNRGWKKKKRLEKEL